MAKLQMAGFLLKKRFAMDIKTENVVLRSELDWLRRKTQFKKRWLKKNYPDIYIEMEAASTANDQAWLLRSVSKAHEGLSRLFKL